MKIAVFSDSHDRVDNLDRAIAIAKEMGITQALHLGDLIAPFVVKENLANSGLQWTCVWGNNDGDKLLAAAFATENVDLAEKDFREVEIEGRKLFLTHYPEIGRIAALSGQYDAVFFGHNHKASQEKIEKTLLANPGEIYGMRTGKASFGVYTPDDNTFEHIWL
jgi:putative phosphoesterase